jgi:hypothetical protein
MSKLAGYQEVAERVHAFYAKHPDGSIRTEHVEFVNVAGKDFVLIKAAAYRSPDDQLPGMGTAMDPMPGLTNFTRNSEVENCETSAWGRALASIGFGGKQIASADEIASKTGGTKIAAPTAGRGVPAGGVAITEKQIGLVRAKSAQKNLHAQEVGLMIAAILGIEMPSGNGDSDREWTGAQLAEFPRRLFQELLMALDEHEGHAKTLTAAQHKANKYDHDGAKRGKAGD